MRRVDEEFLCLYVLLLLQLQLAAAAIAGGFAAGARDDGDNVGANNEY